MFIKSKKGIIISVCSAALIVFYFFYPFAPGEDSSVLTSVQRGDFEISVFTSGELEAKNSVNIMGPGGLRTIGIWQVKISDLIPEGTVVKKGDYIAALDKTEIMNKIKDNETELLKIESQYLQARLDTTLNLRQARDELSNLSFTLKEKQIVLDQSTYEPPATIRQAELDLEKTSRSHEQMLENYKLKVQQAQAKLQEINASLNQAQRKLDLMNDLLGEFTVTAPEDGMLIYHRDWDGKKKVVGSTISVWQPIVATLPDLSVMLSKTYVNEVDIRKVKKDQFVHVSLDAYPEKKLTGTVTSVANVGEQNPRNDAKVFEVNILIHEKDTTLRPAMTTGNRIVAETHEDVLYIPLEAVFNQGDSISFVYKKAGFGYVKQQMQTGAVNDNFAIVLKGLKKDEAISLSPPVKTDVDLVQIMDY